MSHLVHGVEWFEARGENWRGWRFEHLWKKHRCPHRLVQMRHADHRAWMVCAEGCGRQLTPTKSFFTGAILHFVVKMANGRELKRPSLPDPRFYCAHGTPLGCICSKCPSVFAEPQGRGRP